jgi:ankyrin repeat protein
MKYRNFLFLVVSIIFNFSLIQPLAAKPIEKSGENVAKASYPLHDAVRKGDLAAVQSLLEKGYDIEQRLPEKCIPFPETATIIDGNTPLEIALGSRNIKMVKLLLNHGANPYNYRKEKNIFSSYTIVYYDSALYKIMHGYCSAIGDRMEQGKLLPNKKDQQFFLEIIKLVVSTRISFDQFASYIEDSNGETPLQIVDFYIEAFVNKGWKNNKEIKQSLETVKNLIVNQ